MSEGEHPSASGSYEQPHRPHRSIVFGKIKDVMRGLLEPDDNMRVIPPQEMPWEDITEEDIGNPGGEITLPHNRLGPRNNRTARTLPDIDLVGGDQEEINIEFDDVELEANASSNLRSKQGLFLRLIHGTILPRGAIKSPALDREKIKNAVYEFRNRLQNLTHVLGDDEDLIWEFDDGEEGFETLSANMERRFFSIVYNYQTLFPQIAKQGAPRDPSKLFAWVEQSYKAVLPRFRRNAEEGLMMQREALFRYFVHATVLFVILFDDITEATQGPEFDKLLEVANQVRRKRLDKERVNLDNLEGYFELSEAQKGYVNTINAAFDLLYDTSESLAPTDKLEATAKQQIDNIDQLMNEALQELFDQADFGIHLNDLIRGKKDQFKIMTINDHGEREVQHIRKSDLKTPQFIQIYQKKTAPKMQMRFMLLASLKQEWAAMEPEQRRQFDFDSLLDEINELGRYTELQGLYGNEVGSFPREFAQKDTSNVIFLEALNQGVITYELIKRAFRAFDELGPEQSTNLMASIAKIIITGEANMTKVEEEAIPYPIAQVLRKIFHENGPFGSVIDDWNRMHLQMRERFKDSSLSKLIDLEDFYQKQVQFMLQYALASVFKI